ncbi:hypothetical protein GCM10010869_09970 [Mesorhizobium tianshanense]|nr:hypothetical protein GCM10010869_09970 [Mesorhizobium tianshanense]
MEEFQSESDRACAVLGPAFLDDQLRELLKSFLVDDQRVADLFASSMGPLASFSSRIEMAFALGFLAPREVRDLNLIRKVRNEFAHQLAGTSFVSPKVVSWCSELAQCDVFSWTKDTLSSRNRFVLSIVMLANWISIRRLGIQNTRRTVQREPKHQKAKLGNLPSLP